AIEAQMGRPEVYEDDARLAAVMERQSEALGRYEALGGATYASRCESTLIEFGLSAEDLDRPVSELSGGQRKLVCLARAVVQLPDVLLLDEPDNHLDLAGKARLERLIADFAGAVILISHDRYLIDVVADVIAELELDGYHPGQPQLALYPGNYSEYAFEKRLGLERQQQDFVLQQREIGRLRSAIQRLKDWSRNGANEKFVRRWKSMQGRLDRMDRVERPVMESPRMRLALQSERGSNRAIEVKGLRKSFGDTEVLRGADLLVLHGERVGVVGANGAGKSVLFRCLLGEDAPTEGVVRIGPSNTVASYSQEHETLDLSRSAIDEVRAVARIAEGEAVALLSRFALDYDTCRRPIGQLSGGQKSRVQLARLMLMKANILLLDEPTNNLDVASAEVLEDALLDFDGTIVAISHDRYFLDRVAQRIVEVRDGVLLSFEGGYGDYVAAARG
ncbi:MAG: ABC-F family ATP-binding cassette domain-containing protein, partial [Dehalococcoidia bacterium]